MALNLRAIKQFDKSDILKILSSFPEQCQYAVQLGLEAKILFEKKDLSNIIFAGMGGSAIGADLVKDYLYFESKIPVMVCREYDLPAYVGKSTLVIVSSYSGNTEETLSIYEQARAKGAKIVAISSNGRLKEAAIRDKVSFIEIPRGLPPRFAIGYLSIIPLCVLSRLGLINDPTLFVNQVVDVLKDLRDNCLGVKIGQKDNIAKHVATKLFKKIAFIYSGSLNFGICATRFRGQIAENAKALASSHVFPEMTHNEIIGWEEPAKLFKNFVVVMLRDQKINPRVNKRMDIAKELINKEDVEVIEVYSRGSGLLSRIFSLIYIGDFASFYLAMLYRIDPMPVDKNDYLKNEMAKS